MDQKLIDRELLKKDLLNKQIENISNDALEHIIELVNRQPLVCEEDIKSGLMDIAKAGTPKDFGKFLIVYKNSGHTYYDVAYYSSTGQWIKLTGGYISGVTHWFPLNISKEA